jgi:hypothetical protein
VTSFALVIAVGQKYRKELGVGSLVARMLPFSVALPPAWTVRFLAWAAPGGPLGPDSPIFFTPPRQGRGPERDSAASASSSCGTRLRRRA